MLLASQKHVVLHAHQRPDDDLHTLNDRFERADRHLSDFCVKLTYAKTSFVQTYGQRQLWDLNRSR